MGSEKKRKRYHFSDEHREFLKDRYSKQIYPKKKEIAEIADHIGVSGRTVQIWYQNHRAASKKLYYKRLQSFNGDSTINQTQESNETLYEQPFNHTATVDPACNTLFQRNFNRPISSPVSSHNANGNGANHTLPNYSNSFVHGQNLMQIVPTEDTNLYETPFNLNNEAGTYNQSGFGQTNLPINNFVHENVQAQYHGQNKAQTLADQFRPAVIENTESNSSIPICSYSFSVENREVIVNVGNNDQQNTVAQNYANIQNISQQNVFMPESYNQNYSQNSGSTYENYRIQNGSTIENDQYSHISYNTNYEQIDSPALLPASNSEHHFAIDPCYSNLFNLFPIAPKQGSFEPQAENGPSQPGNESAGKQSPDSGQNSPDYFQTEQQIGYSGNGSTSENNLSPDSGYDITSPHYIGTEHFIPQAQPAEFKDDEKIQSQLQDSIDLIFALSQNY